MDLEQAIQQQLSRLKSVESTLQLIRSSAKKQLTQYLSSSKKDQNSAVNQETRKLLDPDGLDEIRANLIQKFEEVEKEETNKKILAKKQAQKLRDNLQKASTTINQLKKEKKNHKDEIQRRQTHKLDKSMQLLRRLRDLQRHLRRHELKL